MITFLLKSWNMFTKVDIENFLFFTTNFTFTFWTPASFALFWRLWAPALTDKVVTSLAFILKKQIFFLSNQFHKIFKKRLRPQSRWCYRKTCDCFPIPIIHGRKNLGNHSPHHVRAGTSNSLMIKEFWPFGVLIHALD